MKLPGFTAEASFGKPTKTYRAHRFFGAGSRAAILPAQAETFAEEEEIIIPEEESEIEEGNGEDVEGDEAEL